MHCRHDLAGHCTSASAGHTSSMLGPAPPRHTYHNSIANPILGGLEPLVEHVALIINTSCAVHLSIS